MQCNSIFLPDSWASMQESLMRMHNAAWLSAIKLAASAAFPHHISVQTFDQVCCSLIGLPQPIFLQVLALPAANNNTSDPQTLFWRLRCRVAGLNADKGKFDTEAISEFEDLMFVLAACMAKECVKFKCQCLSKFKA